MVSDKEPDTIRENYKTLILHVNINPYFSFVESVSGTQAQQDAPSPLAGGTCGAPPSLRAGTPRAYPTHSAYPPPVP